MNRRIAVTHSTRQWLLPGLLGAGLIAACAQGRAPAADGDSAANRAPAGTIVPASSATSTSTPPPAPASAPLVDTSSATPEDGPTPVTSTPVSNPSDAGSRRLPPEPPVATPGDNPGGLLVLAPGQTKSAGDTRLTLQRVVNDSRCPADAQCIWAGEVTIALKVAAPSATQTVEISSSRNNTASVGGVSIEFVSFGPCSGAAAAKRAAGPECASLRVGDFLDR